MALKTLVKVGGITNLSDARYCAGMGVDFLGFSPEPDSGDYMELSKYKEIINWLSGIKSVGELTKMPKDHLNEYHFDALQIQDENMILAIKKMQKPLFFAFKMEQITDLEKFTQIAREYHTDITYFLIESKTIHYTECVDELKDICAEFPVILDFDQTKADDVENLLRQVKPNGIALKGGHEISPGLKDFDGLADVLEVLDED